MSQTRRHSAVPSSVAPSSAAPSSTAPSPAVPSPAAPVPRLFPHEAAAAPTADAAPSAVEPLPPPLPGLPGLAGWLGFDPLSPFVAVFPLMLMTATLNTPIPSLLVCAVTLPLLVILNPRRGTAMALGLVLFGSILTVTMTQAVPISKVGASEVVFSVLGSDVQVNQVWHGTKLGAKIVAVISLAALTGMLASPHDLLRALVQHLRMPYRVPYAGIVALSFIARFSDEHRAIREAHALRGSRFRTPILSVPARWVTSVPALTAAAVRHAERVSMAMDARAFAAYPTRTEPRVLKWRVRDSLLIIGGLALVALMYWAFSGNGFILHDA